jgi:prepilin-type N-terminal cleavage/methylation domain-containing protein
MISRAVRAGFTLIELLIVVAIIAILAAIAVPNFLEAQTRSKVSRTKADMRSVAVAVEAYAADNNKYPRPDFPTWQLPHGKGSVSGTAYEAAGMTTPIAYITSIPHDPFGGGAPDPGDNAYTNLQYFYATKEFYEDTTAHAFYTWKTSYEGTDWSVAGNWTPKWNLQSRGPDRILKKFTNEIDQPQRYAYDSTNGTISTGNIVRVGP